MHIFRFSIFINYYLASCQKFSKLQTENYSKLVIKVYKQWKNTWKYAGGEIKYKSE